MKYRKKPSIIEAMQLTRSYFTVVCEFVGKDNIQESGSGEFPEDECYIDLKTPEGLVTASENDWIAKGHSSVLGVHYWPIKPDYFAEHYEKAEEQADLVIFNKVYSGFESLSDLNRDIHEAFDQRFNPVMENISGEFQGDVKVEIKYSDYIEE